MITVDTPWPEIEALVNQAVAKLKKDVLLFRIHANERSITHRLALYLEEPFAGWDVDCEYSRIGEDPNKYKKLILPEEGSLTDFDMDGSRVYPDIVIHHRTLTDVRDNLLVIEAKTAWSQVGDKRDMLKLAAFTGHFPVEQLVLYRYGLFLKFGEDATVVERRPFEIKK
jgi:hypothetical protein